MDINKQNKKLIFKYNPLGDARYIYFVMGIFLEGGGLLLFLGFVFNTNFSSEILVGLLMTFFFIFIGFQFLKLSVTLIKSIVDIEKGLLIIKKASVLKGSNMEIYSLKEINSLIIEKVNNEENKPKGSWVYRVMAIIENQKIFICGFLKEEDAMDCKEKFSNILF